MVANSTFRGHLEDAVKHNRDVCCVQYNGDACAVVGDVSYSVSLRLLSFGSYFCTGYDLGEDLMSALRESVYYYDPLFLTNPEWFFFLHCDIPNDQFREGI